jgi:signal transduction histidine kinase
MAFWRRPVAWLKAHPFAADCMLAVPLVAITLATTGNPPDVAYRPQNAIGITLLLLASVPIAWRRRAPVAVYGLLVVSIVIYEGFGFPSANSFAAMLGLYTVAAHCSRRTSLLALGASVVGIAIVFLLARWDITAGVIISNAVIFITAWLLGDNLQTRRKYVAGLVERADRAERDKEIEAERAVGAERARIARELHDVVAHSMSVMIVQAGAARRVLAKDPDMATQALTSIEATGREAMTEMRRLLGVLRGESSGGEGSGDGAGALAPQPSLDEISTLVRQCADAGLPVEVIIEGDPRDLPPGTDLSAYRIVQEALTNTLKHGGPAAAEVHIRYADDAVLLEVLDDGRGAAADPAEPGPGQGHGLMGMRERVEVFGGDLQTGPRPGGGFMVKARLPVDPVAS